MRDRIKLKDIAEDAQVSMATVSRVINETVPVSPALRARVLASIERLGYYPDIVAKSLRTRKSLLLGVIIPSISNPYFNAIVRAVEDVALASGYVITTCSHDQDLAKERRYLQALRDHMADGVLIAVADRKATDLSPLVAGGVPVVLIDRILDGATLDSVSVDTERGAYAAVGYLAGRGYQQIGFLGGPGRVSTADDKIRGYARALRDYGLPERDDFILHGAYTEASGFRLGCELLASPSRPDAILVANSMMTLGFCKAIQQCGVRVPHGMAYIGFDEGPWADLLSPPTSRITQPTYELGKLATTMLLDRMSGRYSGEARHRLLPADLLIRGSC